MRVVIVVSRVDCGYKNEQELIMFHPVMITRERGTACSGLSADSSLSTQYSLTLSLTQLSSRSGSAEVLLHNQS